MIDCNCPEAKLAALVTAGAENIPAVVIDMGVGRGFGDGRFRGLLRLW